MASSAGTPIKISAFNSGDHQDKMASSADPSTEKAPIVNPLTEAVAFDSEDSRDLESILKKIDELNISQLPPMEAAAFEDSQEKVDEMASSVNSPTEAVAFDSGDSQEKEDKESIQEEIDKLDISQLPQELRSIDKRELERLYSNAKSISILVTGKTGSGKSTLINGILGLDVKGQAKEGHGLKACTTKVKVYEGEKGEISPIVWDSPGLQDGTENQDEYIKQMKENCSNRDLTIYCIKISDMRLVSGSDEVRAMKKLTEAFGHDFWKTTIIVLTFANVFELIHKEWKYLPKKDKPVVYKEKIQQWRGKIREILTKDINVPDEIVRAIRIVPAGHYRESHLPGYKFWLSKLLLHCIGTISTLEGQAALVKMNAERFKKEEDVTEEDFTKPIEQQPIFGATDIKGGARAA